MKALVDFIRNGKIINFTRFCNLIKIDFELPDKEICLHIQNALFRVFENNKLIISNTDMGTPSKSFKKRLFKRFKWGINTLYDDQIAEHKEKLLGAEVIDVIENGKELSLMLSNELSIDILIYTLEKGHEVYRVFQQDNLDNPNIVES